MIKCDTKQVVRYMIKMNYNMFLTYILTHITFYLYELGLCHKDSCSSVIIKVREFDDLFLLI